MKCDVVLAGVGGQGVLSVSAIIAASSLRSGLQVKQSEEHGMSQRGGAVVTHLRLADRPIHSTLVPRSSADLVLSMEPMEGLRYVDYLSPSGTLLSAIEPVVNFAAYPEIDSVLDMVRSLPRSHLVEATRLAREAGATRAVNMVMVGAASPWLPIEPTTIEDYIRQAFGQKGEKVVDINLTAFRSGRAAVENVASTPAT